ncbi:exported hypothetical protein [Candidatus Zixiibacteriota bacterium]|nr:exported hypothetical protein [candidate division Zixibacteria bacterium]
MKHKAIKRFGAAVLPALIIILILFGPNSVYSKSDQASTATDTLGSFIWVYPFIIDDPTWVKPNTQKDTIIHFENRGTTSATFSSVTAVKLTGAALDWLNIVNPPIVLPPGGSHDMHLLLGGPGVTGPAGYDGIIIFDGDWVGSPDTMTVHLIVADTVQFPLWRSIRTTSKNIFINNAGNMGRDGAMNFGWNGLAFFDDCDTAGNFTEFNDMARIYLYDASPFILRVNESGDTVISYAVYGADWLDGNGFRPLEGLTVDSLGYPDFRYATGGKFITSDSAIALKSEYFAPKSADSSDFIIKVLRIYNNTNQNINGVFAGELMDWDIPSDWGVQNGSGIDITRKMMYMYGAEYGSDTGQNAIWNDCVLADDRVGGFSYFGGYQRREGASFPITNPRGMFTGLNADWVIPKGNFVAGQLYEKLNDFYGYEAWISTHPEMEDSAYQDLSMVACYGRFDLRVGDTLIFVSIYATIYNNGPAGMMAAIDKARSWLDNRPGLVVPPCASCCVRPSDCNHSGTVNIVDISYLINYLYKSGPPPPCMDEADCHLDCVINIIDVSCMINFIYKSGPIPVCPPCGSCNWGS